MTDKAKAERPAVLDQRGNTLELGMRVKLCADKDKTKDGQPRLGTVTGLEYQRGRAVIKVDGQAKKAVRPAKTLWVVKTKSGRIERVERAVRSGKAKATAPAENADA